MNTVHRRRVVALSGLALLATGAYTAYASNHREAPITALDHKADITDLYAFVSYEGVTQTGTVPDRVTFLLNVDPLLEPANGPTLFPFDPAILYEIKVDNDHDALADKIFQFRFETEYRLPDLYAAVAGIGRRTERRIPRPVRPSFRLRSRTSKAPA